MLLFQMVLDTVDMFTYCEEEDAKIEPGVVITSDNWWLVNQHFYDICSRSFIFISFLMRLSINLSDNSNNNENTT